MWFPITTLVVVACLTIAHGRERRSPVVVGLGFWALSLFLASPLIFHYFDTNYLVGVDAFTALCVAGVTAGYLAVRNRAEPREPGSAFPLQDARAALILGGLGALGSVMLLLDARAMGTEFSVSFFLENLSDIRKAQFDALAAATDRGPLGTFGGLLAPLGVLCLIATVWLGRRAPIALRVLAGVNLVLITAVSLGVLAGRATITNTVVMIAIGAYLLGRRTVRLRLRTLVIAGVAFIAVWFLATTFLATRTQNASGEAINRLTLRAELQPWLKPLTRGSAQASLAATSVAYFAAPLPTLHFYMDGWALPGPYFGGYSFPLPTRIAGTSIGTWDREDWYNLRQEIFLPIAGRGYSPNVWATWVRDLAVDFGYVGAVIFCVLFGAFMAWASNRAAARRALHYFCLEVVACFTFAMGAFTSFMFDPFVYLPFFYGLILMVAVRAVAGLSTPVRMPAR